MTGAESESPRSLLQAVELAWIGDVELNRQTQKNANLANTVAYASKKRYEDGLDYRKRISGEPDPIYKGRFAVVALEHFVTAKVQAAGAAAEFLSD